ncbi:MAG: magnesium transporter CorA family protein [Candidatus Pacebacteria bacterium]|nr:magnesium transporter CorA family protein [Candidatus Paceibacterota bacterium]
MINIYKSTVKSPELKKIKNIEPGSWIQVVRPTEQEIELLVKTLKIDPTILEDGLDENEIPRVEKEDGVFYMIIRFPTIKDNYISTFPLLVIITEEHIVTVCKKEEYITRCFLKKDEDFQTTKRTQFVLKAISEIFRNYDSYLNKILKDIKQKKFEINHLRNRDILFLVQEEETLNDFISALVPTINITERILRGKYITIYDKDVDVVEDLVMDSKQTLELSKNGLKSIKNIREAYSTILTNDLNKVMKFLTIATIMLTVPTIISSVFGMNVPLPMQDSPMAFFYIMGIIAISSLVLFYVIVKRRWF